MIACLNHAVSENYALYNGDCVEVLAQLPERSIDLAVYSPPFADLYVYSDSERDMGNSTQEEFDAHYGHMLPHLYRVIRPGRIVAVHCMDLNARKSVEGYMGLRDFSGDLIRAHIKAGFVYLSRITIWKDPVSQQQRTKAHNLLYKNIQDDSTRCYPGLPDYVLLFRRPVEAGDDAHTIKVPQKPEGFPLEQWQEWASPVWMTIDQQNTLNRRKSGDEGDERHICPLQLDTIERLVRMYTNPGETVLSPFAGIGSEGHVALTWKRKFVGIELKESYFGDAVQTMKAATDDRQRTLFG